LYSSVPVPASIDNVVLATLVLASSIVNDVLGKLLGSTWLTVSFLLRTTPAIASIGVTLSDAKDF